MNDIYKYDLGHSVLNGIDIQTVQPNYFVKYGSGAIESQRRLLERLGIGELFDRRVMIAPIFGNKILSIGDLYYSGYENPHTSRCNGYDGIITTEPNMPLISGWGDCPWLLVASNSKIGTVHATRDTLDMYILDNFFDSFLEGITDKSELRIGFSPYIPQFLFDHDELNMKRKSDWIEANAVDESNGKYLLDLKKIIFYELERLDIPLENISDGNLNSWEISNKSHEQGGYSVSHRHAKKTIGSVEGRGAFCLMLRD